jgi:hypothetical protein
LGPVVEQVAQQLYSSWTAQGPPRRWAQRKPQTREGPEQLPTPLTEHRRQQGRAAVRVAAGLGGEEPGGSNSRQGQQAIDPRLTKEHFLRHVVPALRAIPAARIAEAVGLSKVYCAKIRAGQGLPHRQHWPAFARLVTLGSDVTLLTPSDSATHPAPS